MGFTKLDQSILQSSIMAAKPKTFKVWIALLAACDSDGVARVSETFLSRVCYLSLSDVRKALEELSSPDPSSRTPDKEGRRIEKVEGGYLIINYLKYRKAYSETPGAIRFRRWYEKKNKKEALGLTQPNVRNVRSNVEAEAEAEAEAENENEIRYFKSWCQNKIIQWNLFAKEVGLPTIRGIIPGSKRERFLKARFKEKEFEFDNILEKIRKSPFLLGLKSDWKVTFDWIIAPSNYLKILEGTYDSGLGSRDKLKASNIGSKEYFNHPEFLKACERQHQEIEKGREE